METDTATQRQPTRYFQLAVLLLFLVTTIACAGGALAPSSAYTVQPGDTLARIAKDHGTTVETLVALNKGRYPSLVDNPGLIEVGWTLQLPGGADPGTQHSVAKPVVTLTPVLTIEEAELEIVRLINEERAKVGAPPLAVDPVLMEVARLRSKDMVDRGYFAHTDPVTGEYLYQKMLAERGYHSPGGEIVTKLLHTTSVSGRIPPRAVRNWLGSQAHREIALRSEATQIGAGLAAGSNYLVATALLLR